MYLVGDTNNYYFVFEQSSSVGSLTTVEFVLDTNSYTIENVNIGGNNFGNSPMGLITDNSCDIDIVFDFQILEETIPINVIEEVLSLGSTHVVDINRYYLSYSILNSDNDILLTVYLSMSLFTVEGTWSTFGFNWCYMSYSNLMEAFENGYLQGKLIGESEGYELGYSDGFREGQNTVVPSPFEMIVDGVDRFFNITLFGDVKISTIFMIAFGSLMLGILLKVFLGG
jgi:hypothetical protein